MGKLLDGDLDSYSRLACQLILARFPEWEPFATLQQRADGGGNVVDFVVPCPSTAAEHDLWVSTMDEELSVGFHTHHSHFTNYEERTNLDQIKAGIACAEDILAERIGVVSWYRGDTFAGSHAIPLPHAGPIRGLMGDASSQLINLFGECDRLTVRSWLGTYDRDESEAT